MLTKLKMPFFRCYIANCQEVACPKVVCPGHITCLCKEKLPTTKLRMLIKNRTRGGGARSFVHSSKLLAREEEMLQETRQETDMEVDSNNNLDESISEDSEDSDDDNEAVCYDKNTASWDNLCLAVMRHPDQSIHAAAEIATAVLKVSIFLLIE